MPFTFGSFRGLVRISASRSTQTFLALRLGAAGFQRVVCLKTLNPELCADERARGAFAAAAKLAAKLNHPACVGVESFGRERGVYYLTMEYVTGETWETILAGSPRLPEPLPAHVVVQVIAELCEGLHDAHEQRGPEGPYHIVHRGISSNNILIDDHVRPRIIDFATGKSNLSPDSTETGIIKGSFRYMAPEQIQGRAPDRRADVYALGEVLFESLAGASKENLALEELAASKLDVHPRLSELRPDVDPGLDAICAKALATDPADRYQTAEEMHFALSSYLKGSAVKARAQLAASMEQLFGREIAARKEIMRKLASGAFDERELITVLEAEPANERDVFEGSKERFDEAAFLATIRAGEMGRESPIESAAAPLPRRGQAPSAGPARRSRRTEEEANSAAAARGSVADGARSMAEAG